MFVSLLKFNQLPVANPKGLCLVVQVLTGDDCVCENRGPSEASIMDGT